MPTLLDTDWTPDFPGERYHARRYLGAHLSAGSNRQDWKGPRAPWVLGVDCTRPEAEALVRELGGEAKARGSTDATWIFWARGDGADQADAQGKAEALARRVVEMLTEMRRRAA